MAESPAELESRLPRTVAELVGGMQAGWHVGAQVFVSIEGRTVADFGLGEARPGVPMTADTLMLWLSAGKPVTAAAVLQLVERGQLHLEDPVAQHVPEFAEHGKESFTLWNLLTHTAGFRFIDINWPNSSWDEVIARICRAKPERNWTPGERAGYHPFTSWYILGEVVQRVTGRPFSRYVREEIFLPLEMRDSWIGMPAEQFDAYGDRLGLLVHTDKAEPYAQKYASRVGLTACVPGGNGCGPMHDLGRFYRMLLGGGALDGVRVLSSESVSAMTRRQREGMFDETFRHTMDWGLGLIINSNQYGADTVPYGYGPYSSEQAFGHGGAQCSLGFADPARQLAAGLVFNGMPGELQHNARAQRVLAALYQDLGFAGE